MISYAITVKDELEEITRLLKVLRNHLWGVDEIIVLYDNKNGSWEVWKYLDNLHQEDPFFKLHEAPFGGHFANWKNYLNSLCSQPYIFNIDADEYPDQMLLHSLHDLLSWNTGIDVFKVSRINIVEGITSEHIKKWRWKVNEEGWINFPDKQMRIYRNTPEIKWINKVHEVIDGYKTISELPEDEQWCLIHTKNIERQEKQNNYYATLS